MICPNCGSNVSDKRKRCDRCGTDLTLYQKIYRASNLCYNNGLARAKVRDLSGAVIALRKSLELNKLNSNARNLLGLIYYEMGETVAALSEWVISRHFQPKNNDAEEYINRVQSNLTKLDALNQAIKRYNTALNYAKQGSDDLAVIQLKKVVTLNPHFIRAFNLLALLHIKAGDNEKARKYLVKSSKIDVSNTVTLRYLQEMETPEGREPEESSETQSSISTIIPLSSYKEDKPNIMAFVNLVIGVVIGIALMAFLVIPTIKKNNDASVQNANNSDSSTIKTQLQQKEQEITTLKSDNETLQKQVKELQSKVDNTAVPKDQTSIYEALFTAVDQYLTELNKTESTRDYSGVAEALAAVDNSKIDNQKALSLLEGMKTVVYPIMTQKKFETGRDLCNKGKFEEAITELTKAITYDANNVDAIYFMGRSYDRMGDKENATVYYNKVINDFPDSARVRKAKSYLKLLK